MINLNENVLVRGDIEILGFERGKRKVLHQHTTNIIVEGGRRFLCENAAASAFAGASFTRHQNTVVRYIGFGIGGSRQTHPDASSSPLSDTYPAGYGGTNAQTDTDMAVSRLERPVKATATNWLMEVATPASFPTTRKVRWTATFGQTDVNLAPYTLMPISEIALYKNTADPTLPNGGAGTYPGATGHIVAYDTFTPVPKTGFFSLQVFWTWTF